MGAMKDLALARDEIRQLTDDQPMPVCVWCREEFAKASPKHSNICMSCYEFSEESYAAQQKRDAEHALWVARIRKHPAYLAAMKRLHEAEKIGTEQPLYGIAAE